MGLPSAPPATELILTAKPDASLSAPRRDNFRDRVQRSVVLAVDLNPSNGHDDVVPLYDTPKNCVLPIEPRARTDGNEEL